MSKPVQIAIVVICLAGAAFLLINFVSKPKANAGDSITVMEHYICPNPECGHGFTWEKGMDLGGREFPDVCTKCGTYDAPKAARCDADACGHFQLLEGHGTFEDPCPECGADMPDLLRH